MTPKRNKHTETQQPSPKHNPNVQSSTYAASSSSFAYPPGLRFVPTDKELIYYYLKPFSRDNTKSWPNLPIHHVNIYESNPQQLSEEYQKGNLTEWFFISERTKLKINGKNQKRSNNGGYWHAKAVTKKIKAGQGVVGYKTTLNYYVGKQPNGVKTDWLMQEYWLQSSDNNNTVDYAMCKIYLSPMATKNKKEEDVEGLEEEVVQPHNVENQQPQPQLQPQPQPHEMLFWTAELDSHQPQLHYIAYQEPQQSHPLDTTDHHQSHQLQLWQATLTQSHDHELHPLDAVQDQLPQLWPVPLDSHPPHCHDIKYQQPQPLDAIEYQHLYQWQFCSDPLDTGPLTMCDNMIDQDKSNGDSKKVVDHALKICLTPRGIKREVEEEEENEKRKKKKKDEEEGVEASKEDVDCFLTGFVDTHLLHIDIESITNCCLTKCLDKD